MKTIIDKLRLQPFASRLMEQYFGNRPFAVFDIETTGLSPVYCKVILSGILRFDGGQSPDQAQVIQLFADRPDDEKQLLAETIRILDSVDYVITYNGRHFDIPFVEKRAKKHGLSFRPPYDLDLYQIVSGHSPLRQILPSLKQKSLEQYLGLSDGRDDEISGAESVALYERYMASHAFQLERQILLHNHDDVIQLYRLLPIIAKTDFHRAMFRQGFLAGDCSVAKIQLAGRDLCAEGFQLADPKDFISFPTDARPYTLIMNRSSRTFELQIPGQAEAGALYLDALAVLGEEAVQKIEKYPSVVNGYLITQDHKVTNYMEINAFLKVFFENLAW